MGQRHNVTDLVRIERCETQVQLDRKFGEKVDVYTQKRRTEGIRFHAQKEAGSDTRCYVATALFGLNSPEVKILRLFRDRFLMASNMGQKFCALYYRFSPWCLRAGPACLAPPLRLLLKVFCQILKKRFKAEDSST